MKFQLSHKWNAYATHQPVLIHAARKLFGSVLEMGCGEGSTGLLHYLCPGTETIDHDKEWIDKYSYKFPQGHFSVMSFDEMLDFSKKVVDDLRVCSYKIVFLDQGDWTSREKCAFALKDKAKVVIVHDSDAYGERPTTEGVLSPMFKWHKTFLPDDPMASPTGPPTFVGSNFIDVTKWEIDFSIDEVEI